LAFEYFRLIFAIHSRRRDDKEPEPDPVWNAGFSLLLLVLPGLCLLQSALLPDWLQFELDKLSGPYRSRDPWQALLFIAPKLVVFIPGYYYFFLSGWGRRCQEEFDRRVASFVESRLGYWKWFSIITVLGIALPGLWFVKQYPLAATAYTLCGIAAAGLLLRHRRLGLVL
jgi:hypothetical protein